MHEPNILWGTWMVITYQFKKNDISAASTSCDFGVWSVERVLALIKVSN